MVDDLPQQPTDTSSPVINTPSIPEPVSQPIAETPPVEIPQPTIPQPETPVPENPIAEPVQPPENSQPVVEVPVPENPEAPQAPQVYESSQPVSPEPMPVVPIPQLRLPFNGSFPLTFGFGAQPEKEELKQKFLGWGIIGHHGLDFGLPVETEIIAVDYGKVIQSGENGDFGISVILQHSWGISLYAHLSETKVIVDQQVNTGDVLGLSGRSTFTLWS